MCTWPNDGALTGVHELEEMGVEVEIKTGGDYWVNPVAGQTFRSQVKLAERHGLHTLKPYFPNELTRARDFARGYSSRSATTKRGYLRFEREIYGSSTKVVDLPDPAQESTTTPRGDTQESCVPRLPFKGHITPDALLRDALEKADDFELMAVIGNKNGRVHIGRTEGDLLRMIGMLEAAKAELIALGQGTPHDQ